MAGGSGYKRFASILQGPGMSASEIFCADLDFFPKEGYASKRKDYRKRTPA